METTEFKFTVSPDDPEVAYLSLPGHPGKGTNGAVARQVRIADIVLCTGPDIYLDLDSLGRVIGIEILA